MIEIINVTKRFDRKNILLNVCLSIPAGSITCFLGPSGSGKTTLIRLITGSIKPDDGKIRIGNYPIPNRKILHEIGYMPQNDALYYDLSGLGNLLFFGGLFGIYKNLLKERVAQVLDIVNLTSYKNILVKKYSHGMKKRLSLAISILNNPKIIILDEPTTGIDPLLRRYIWQKLINYRDNGCTIIITTHVMEEALECDLAALIFEGKIITCDSVDNLLKRTDSGKIEELFINETGRI